MYATQTLTHLILITLLSGSNCYFLYFTAEETETQRDRGICLVTEASEWQISDSNSDSLAPESVFLPSTYYKPIKFPRKVLMNRKIISHKRH